MSYFVLLSLNPWNIWNFLEAPNQKINACAKKQTKHILFAVVVVEVLKRPKSLLERYQRFLTESLVDVGHLRFV